MIVNHRQLLASLTASLTWVAAGCRDGVKTRAGTAQLEPKPLRPANGDIDWQAVRDLFPLAGDWTHLPGFLFVSDEPRSSSRAMERTEQIRTSFERNAKAMALRPSVGQGTAVTKVKWRDGLTCDAEDGNWKLTVDASQKVGGDGRAPDPGVYGRTALGSCLAIGYVLWGAKLGVEFTRLEVDVQADYDSGGSHGISATPPGYRQMRYVVTAESDAPESEILKVLDAGDAHSPLRDDFARAIDVRREVRIATRSAG